MASDVTEMRRYRHPLLETLRRVRSGRGSYAVSIVGGIAQHGFAVVAGGASGWLVGLAARASRPADFLAPLTLLAVAVVGSSLGTWVAEWFGHVFAFRYQARLRVQLYDGIERSAPRELLGRRTGELAAIALGDVDALHNFFAHLAINATVSLAVGAGAVVALAIIHPLLASIAALGMLASVVAPSVIAVRTKTWGERLRSELGALNADAVDGIQGLRELLVFQRVDAFRNRIVERTRDYQRQQMRYAAATGFQRAVTEGLVSATTVALLIAAVGMTASGSISLVSAIVAVMVTASAFGPVTQAIEVAGELSPLRASATRVLEILDQAPQVADTATATPRLANTEIRFDDVWFAYDPETPILRGISFTVAPGETVALVGRSGAGKSTCANLLLRFWDVDRGAITLGGQDLRAFPLAELHRLVAVVLQDVYLFYGSVADNLRLGHEYVTQAQIEAAARTANAHDFIMALPNGYATQVGERGAQLSGGQSQRLAIARALLHDSPVLVMDEAASNLDTENEQAVLRALHAARRGRTTLVIAHRLSTILSADRIVVLDGGKIVETGMHDELVASAGVYARLIADQRAGLIGAAG
jgi:ABC-type multidrug transport system fused ATPase/permease subunit